MMGRGRPAIRRLGSCGPRKARRFISATLILLLSLASLQSLPASGQDLPDRFDLLPNPGLDITGPKAPPAPIPDVARMPIIAKGSESPPSRPPELIPTPSDPDSPPSDAELLKEAGAAQEDVYAWGDEGAAHLAAIHTEDVNYLDASGEWRDLKLVETDSGWDAITGEGGDVTVSFPAALGSKSPVVFAIGGGAISVSPVGVESATAVADGLGVRYPDALHDTDITYTLDSTGYKETIIWKTPEAPGSLSWDLSVRNLVLVTAKDGSIELANATGSIGAISPPKITDAKGSAIAAGYLLTPNVDGSYRLELQIDPATLKDAAYPITIDPGVHDNSGNPEEAEKDTYVDGSNQGSSFMAATQLKVGNTPARHTYVKFAVGAFQKDERLVYDANMWLEQISGTGGNILAHRVDQTWPATMTWNNKPTVNQLIDGDHEFLGGFARWQLKEQYQHIIQTNYANHWSNEGTRLSKPEGTSEWVFYSTEAAPGTPGDPILWLTWNDLPASPTLDTPAGAATVKTTSPTLKVNAVPNDFNNDGVYVQFQVSDDGTWTGSHLVHQSGWLLKQKSYVVPSGILVDGTQYWWRARSWDNFSLTDGAGVVRDPNTSGARTFTVSLSHLGEDQRWAMWSQPLGNSMTLKVNQANGNLFLDVPLESLTAPIADVGIGLSYNHQATAEYGASPGWDVSIGPSNAREDLPIELETPSPQPSSGVDIRMRGGRKLHFPHDDGRVFEAEGAGAGRVTKNGDDGYIYDAPDGSRFVFKPNGNLERAKPSWSSDAGGPNERIDYSFSDHAGTPRLDWVQDPLGRRVNLTWNATSPSRLTTITSWDAGKHWDLAYSSGHLSTVTTPAGEVFELAYDAAGRLSEIRDGQQHADATVGWKIEYAQTAGDSSGTWRVSKIYPPGSFGSNNRWTFTYQSPFKGTTAARAIVTDPRGTATATPTDDYQTQTDFNWAALPVKISGPADQTGYWPITSMVWDSNNNVICKRTPAANAVAVGAVPDPNSSDANQPCRSESLTTVYEYDSHEPYRMKQVTYPAPDTAGQGARQVQTYSYDDGITGLWAELFGTADLSGLPKGQRVWGELFNNWGTGSPSEIGHDDNWSIRFTGYLDLRDQSQAKDYEFRASTNDGVTVTIGDKTVTDCFGQVQNAQTYNCGLDQPVEKTLSPGLRPITIEFSELTDLAFFKLEWDQGLDTGSGDWEIMPQSRFLPDIGLLTTETLTLGNGLTRKTTWNYPTNDARARHLASSVTTSKADGTEARTVSFTYNDPWGQTATITTPAGTSENTYDNGTASWDGTLTVSCLRSSKMKRPDGSVLSEIRYECDRSGDVTKQTSLVPAVAGTPQPAADRVTLTTYDDVGRVATIDHLGNGSAVPDVVYIYDLAGRKTQERTLINGTQVATSTFEYFPMGTLKKVTFPDPDAAGSGLAPSVIDYTYDWVGNQLSATDPRNASWITNTTYDAQNRPIQVQGPDPDGAGAMGRLTTTTEYRLRTGTAYDQRVTVTSPASVQNVQTADVLGRVSTEKTGSLASSSFTYDQTGKVLTSTSPDPDGAGSLQGIRTDTTYNVHGQPATVTTFPGTSKAATTTNTYDSNGLLTTVDGPLASDDLVYEYDAAGRVTKITQPGITVPGTSPPAAVVTNVTYDAVGERVAVSVPLDVDTTNVRQWAYDQMGRVTLSRNASIDTTFSYNDAGWLTGVNDPRPGVADLVYVYDNLGRMTERRSGASTDKETYSWDLASNQTTAKTYAANGTTVTSTVTTNFDAYSRPTTVVAGSDTTTLTYHPTNGLMTSAADAAGTTAYTYTTDGLVDTIDDPITTGVADYAYDQAGRVLTRTDTGSGTPNIVWTRAYEPETGRVDTQTITKGATTLLSSNLDYDLAGDVTARTQTVNGIADSWTYQYDPASRLTSATLNGGTTTEYKYDGAGNRYSVKEGAAAPVTTEFSSASYPVSSSDGATYSTDELGNLTGTSGGTNPTASFTYDSWSQLRSATQGGSTINYALDALGRLLTRTVGASSTSYLYRALSEDISKATPSSGSATTYAYSAGGPLAQKTGTTSRLFLRDPHGDVLGLTTTTGTVQGTKTYDPFGRPRSTTGETSVFGFQGSPTDATTGLVDMVTRHYLPTLGRFITADQVFGNLMLPLSLNRFTYAVGNPVTLTDPNGMCANPAYCPAPTSSSHASAQDWYDTGATLNEPAYGESSGYQSYVSDLYVEHPDLRPPTYRPQFFNRLPNLVRDRGMFDPSYASFDCQASRFGGRSCGVQVEDEGGGFMSILHNTLDLVGFIPVVGEVADGANALLYGVEGDWVNAAIYAGAVIIPTSGKALRAGKELVEEGVELVAKNVDEVVEFAHEADFIVTSSGEAIIVPAGATGPKLADNGAGFLFTGGSGGHGLSPAAADVRVMDPVAGGPHPSPNGYVAYHNTFGQKINPFTGRTVSPSDPFAHWQLGGAI